MLPFVRPCTFFLMLIFSFVIPFLSKFFLAMTFLFVDSISFILDFNTFFSLFEFSLPHYFCQYSFLFMSFEFFHSYFTFIFRCDFCQSGVFFQSNFRVSFLKHALTVSCCKLWIIFQFTFILIVVLHFVFRQWATVLKLSNFGSNFFKLR